LSKEKDKEEKKEWHGAWRNERRRGNGRL